MAGLVTAVPVRLAGPAAVAGPVWGVGLAKVTGPARLAEIVRVDDQASPVAPGMADSAAAAAAAVVVGMGSWFVD